MHIFTPFVFSASVVEAAAIVTQSLAKPSNPTVTNPLTDVTFQGNLSSGVESFLNIKFGEDTSGCNRFALPKSFHYPHGTVVDASKTGAACAQANITGIFASDIQKMSEDCLTLRIDRLANTTANAKLPVMIYLYGGGYTSGQIYDPNYNPTGLLKSAKANGSPIIYAAINYRLGLFGFASTPALVDSGSLNAGLYDQRLGMEWIKANVHLFGGDPENITIFGESAGAFSVGHQINAFGGEKPVPFSRAIMQSGMSTSVSGTTGDICAKRTKIIAQELNCTSQDSKSELDCLRAVPYDVLLPVVSKFELSVNSNALLVWQPIAPSPFIPEAPSKLLRSGRFAKGIDIMNGWNENDGSLFVETNIMTDAEVLKTVASPAALDEATTRKLLSLYPLALYHAEKSGNNTATARFFRASEMIRDLQFVCPSLLLEEAMARYSGSYKPSNYLFVMNTTLYTPKFQKENMTFLGVAHGSDIPFVFDTAAAVSTATTEQKQLAAAMAASWSSFAASANVSEGDVALTGWEEGYQRRNSGFKVRVMGGPSHGMTSINVDGRGVLASEHLIERCAFWNSEEVGDQLQK